jgi:hypothetical protein
MELTFVLLAQTQFDIYKKIKHHYTDIKEFWILNKNYYPQLYEIALRVLSVPVSSSEVERSFSMLKLISSDLRKNLSTEKLIQISYVKKNYFSLNPPDDRNDRPKNPKKKRKINKKKRVIFPEVFDLQESNLEESNLQESNMESID